MPNMITLGSELIRINPAKNTIEYSTNGGRFWVSRCTPFGNELIAITSKGVYASTNKGSFWVSRCTSSSYGEFLSLTDGGKEILAQTSKGLYYSTNGGRFWVRR